MGMPNHQTVLERLQEGKGHTPETPVIPNVIVHQRGKGLYKGEGEVMGPVDAFTISFLAAGGRREGARAW